MTSERCLGCEEEIPFDKTGKYHQRPGCGLIKCTSERGIPKRIIIQVPLEHVLYPLRGSRCPFSFGVTGSTKCLLLWSYKKSQARTYAVKCPPDPQHPQNNAAHPCCPFRNGAKEIIVKAGSHPEIPEILIHEINGKPEIIRASFGLSDAKESVDIKTLFLKKELSSRAYNALASMGVETIADLENVTDIRLFSKKYIGKKTLIEVIALAEKYGTEIKIESPDTLKLLEKQARINEKKIDFAKKMLEKG